MTYSSCVRDIEGDALRAWLEERRLDSLAANEEFHALCARVGTGHCKPTPRCASCVATPPPGWG